MSYARVFLTLAIVVLASSSSVPAQQARANQDTLPPRTTQKPPLHGTTGWRSPASRSARPPAR